MPNVTISIAWRVSHITHNRPAHFNFNPTDQPDNPKQRTQAPWSPVRPSNSVRPPRQRRATLDQMPHCNLDAPDKARAHYADKHTYNHSWSVWSHNQPSVRLDPKHPVCPPDDPHNTHTRCSHQAFLGKLSSVDPSLLTLSRKTRKQDQFSYYLKAARQ